MLVSGWKQRGNTGWLSKNKSTHSRFENEGTRSLLLKRHLTQLEDERFPRGWRNIFIDVIEGFPRKKIITGTTRVSETVSLTGEQNRCTADKNWTHLYLFFCFETLRDRPAAAFEHAEYLEPCEKTKPHELSCHPTIPAAVLLHVSLSLRLPLKFHAKISRICWGSESLHAEPVCLGWVMAFAGDWRLLRATQAQINVACVVSERRGIRRNI